MTRDIRLLALDLDGTLTNRQKEITPRTQAALHSAMRRGVKLALASGRPTVGIWPLARQLGLPAQGGYLLAYNGGQAVDCATGETLYQKRFPPQLIAPVCAFAAAQGLAVLCYNDSAVVTETPDDPGVQTEAEINRIPIQRVGDLPAYLSYPICKLLITVPPARMAQVEALAQKQFAGQLAVFRSCAFFLEIVPRGVGKDAALQAILQRSGLRPAQLMAMGDGMNDLPMLRFAGLGVAMANGDEAVKACADAVTRADNDHDGVAEAVETYILGK